MSLPLSRRTFCRLIGSAAPLAVLPRAFAAPAADRAAGLTLSIGNYGMQSLTVEEAVALVLKSGFDGIELSVMPDWSSAPARLSAERRQSLRRLLADNGLALNSLMEDLHPSAAAALHQQTLDRLQQAVELGHDLSPEKPPLVQTVLGGGSWTEKRELFRDRIGDWMRLAESHKTIVAVKPHRGGAMSQPAEAAWLFEQLGKSEWLGMVYDYSHYAFRDLSIAETVKTAFPFTVHVAVKDAVRKGNKVEFALPGAAGTIDYGEILSTFYRLGYRRDVCCEVSSQVWRAKDYDAATATRACYSHMQSVFEKSQIPSRQRKSP
ncbi:MAG TPA: sugar phosphate isomerase/epimerase [Planctomycetaceae bacterium]|jgi:sugar phosphate isomerase/epimerase